MSKEEKINSLETKSYKGVRDFYPEDMFVENYIFGVWKHTAESFGYLEYNASILEPSELYRAKSSEEIVKEQTYTFIDRGEREVTLRPEMTPTVARMVAGKRRELNFPLRWYSIPNIFRYERPQRGRLREHFQLNVDIFGVSDIEAEVEMISLVHAIMKNFGMAENQFVIKINDREPLYTLIRRQVVSPEQQKVVIMLLDKKDKLSEVEFREKLKAIAGEAFDWQVKESQKVQDVISALHNRGIRNVQFSSSLIRGFEYYSGIVFEVFDTHPDNKRALFGGGRYDNLVEIFGGEKIPAVGFGMGDVTTRDVLETYGLLPKYHSTTSLSLCVLDESFVTEANRLAEQLRLNGVTVAVDLSGKKLGDQIKKASKDGIPYILCIGEEEVKSGIFKLKELESGKEEALKETEIALRVLRG
jgi:histidyl-tRNA synthetase